MSRLQARRGNGRWQRNTLENTFGLHAGICPTCNSFNPHGVTEQAPDICVHCGGVMAVCAHGRCTERFPSRPHYPECGKIAVAMSIDRRWPFCADHAEGAE